MSKTWSVSKIGCENGCRVAYVNARKFLRCRMALTRTWLLVSFAVLLLGLSGAANATRPTVISTDPATGVTATGATLNGTINPQNRSTTVTFNYGLTVAYGSTVTATQSPVAANAGNTAVSAPLSGLTCNTTYHYQVAATNSSGAANPQGGDVTFTTSACLPTVTSINLVSASPTNAASVQWTVTFSQSETGVTASNFTLVNTGLGGTPAITAVSGSGTTWTVTASTGTGSGSLGLNATSAAGMSPAVTGLPFTGQVYSIDRVAPTVSSINLASPNPTTAASVSWTVTFSKSVTGVSASNFSLVITGLGGPPTITSVSGSGTTWTVTASTGSGTGSLGLNQTSSTGVSDTAGNALTGTFTGQVYTVQAFCSPPSNIPAGVTVSCVCDTFGRASLNPSTIYGANWVVSTSDTTGIVPYINNTTGLLRLTENTGNNAKAATVPGIFPAAGNYISVEFQHYAYNGSGADGIAVTLSDYSVPAVPGAFGGSLGYAQKTGAACPTPPCNGFAGGWIGVALDEFGNYQNPTEGRIGGPGSVPESVGMRGSGSGTSGYNFLAGTASLTPIIDNRASTTPAPGYYYQVVVDARNDPTSTAITVNRDTTGTGTSYTQLINIPNVYTTANAQGFTQNPVPTNWQISFTGSTGGSTNIHEIGGLRICAQTAAPPSGGTPSGFNAIDEAYATPPATPAVQNFLSGHVYMKLVGTSFKLWLAAINNNQILTTYAASGNKNVTVSLVDNSDGVCVLDSTQANYCSAACRAKTAITGGSQTVTFASSDSGKKQSASFTLNSAFKNLAAIMSDGTTSACSTDAFSVRPLSIASVTSSNATNAGPIFKAGSDNFSLTATTTGIAGNPSGYTGVLKINSAASGAIQPLSPATTAGSVAPTTFPAATSGTPSSTATGNTFTYSEVGAFSFLGYNPATDTTSARGVYDGVEAATDCSGLTATQCDAIKATTWTGVDSISTKGDCVSSSYSNTKDASGKYGCNFGIIANTGNFGRFIPAYFDVTPTQNGCTGSTFTYSGQPFRVTVTPFNAQAVNTKNYTGTLAKAVTISDPNGATNCPSNTCFANNVIPATAFLNVGGTVSGSTYFVTNPLGGPNPPMTYTFVAVAKETQPLALTLRATEPAGADGVSSQNHTEGSTTIDSGRIHLQNAYGSELADLPMSMRVEYYSGASDGWVANGSDTCSSVGLKAFTNPQGNMTVGKTCVQDTGNPGVSGQGCATSGPAAERYLALPSLLPPSVGSYNLYMQAPGAGNQGSVDVTANLVTTLPWLQYDWNGTGTAIEPTGKASFGLYRASPRSIYMRERY